MWRWLMTVTQQKEHLVPYKQAAVLFILAALSTTLEVTPPAWPGGRTSSTAGLRPWSSMRGTINMITERKGWMLFSRKMHKRDHNILTCIQWPYVCTHLFAHTFLAFKVYTFFKLMNLNHIERNQFSGTPCTTVSESLPESDRVCKSLQNLVDIHFSFKVLSDTSL